MSCHQYHTVSDTHPTTASTTTAITITGGSTTTTTAAAATTESTATHTAAAAAAELAYQQHAIPQQPQQPIIPLEPPPPNFVINSRAAMQATLDAWTLSRGYSMRIAGAKVTGKRKVRWVCFRGGEARHHRPPVDPSVFVKAKEEGRRKPTTDRTSKKCGCLFKFEVIETAKDSDV